MLALSLPPTFVQFMESQFESKANKRVRNSILAFTYNDYGDVCYSYYLQDGDERFYESARKAYKRAGGLNPAFVIPCFNLQRLSAWKWEFEKARDYLMPVIRLEPKWPDGKLALANVNSQLMEGKRSKAEKEHKEADKKEQGVKGLEKELRKYSREAEELRKKVSRMRERRLPEDIRAAVKEDGKPGGKPFFRGHDQMGEGQDTEMPPYIFTTGWALK